MISNLLLIHTLFLYLNHVEIFILRRKKFIDKIDAQDEDEWD